MICTFFLLNGSGYSQNIDKLRMDLDKAYGGNLSEYFSNVEYIPLETIKESLFGQTSSILITDNSFVIWDEDTRGILFFSGEGKYLRKIKVPQNIYPSFYLEDQSKMVVVLYSDYQKKQVQRVYYTTEGKPAAKEKSTIMPFNEFKYFLPLEGDYFIKPNACFLNLGQRAMDKNIYLLDVYKNDTLVKSFLPYNQKTNLAQCTLGMGQPSITRSGISDSFSLLVTTPLDYYVYAVNKDTAIKVWQFVFPQNDYVNKQLLTNTNEHYMDSLRKTKWFNDKMILGINNLYRFKEKLLFKIERVMYYTNESSESNKQNNFLYNFNNKRLISFERITPDQSCYYLPHFDKTENFHKLGLIYNKDFFYTSISSLKMFWVRDATKSKNAPYPPVLQEYFKTQNRKSNPVMLRMKLKD